MSLHYADSKRLPKVRFKPTPAHVSGQLTHAFTNYAISAWRRGATGCFWAVLPRFVPRSAVHGYTCSRLHWFRSTLTMISYGYYCKAHIKLFCNKKGADIIVPRYSKGLLRKIKNILICNRHDLLYLIIKNLNWGSYILKCLYSQRYINYLRVFIDFHNSLLSFSF